jgi:pimeloyl-ACP methyl ester carboxylesterase
VGRSTPVSCGLTFKQALVTAPWPQPGGAAGNITGNAQLARTVARQCAARSGALLRFITTANTARDMDRIRAALGVRKISYYGISYGSYLGAVYASLFPQRTDRVVLDSVTNPDGVWRRSGFVVAGAGVEIRFPDFARFAAGHNPAYHLGATIAQVRALYLGLAARLDRAPMRTPSGTLLGSLFRDVTIGAMYSDQVFAFTARFWQAVKSGDARTVAGLGDQIGLWNAAAFNAAKENSVAADLAVVCDDASWPRSVRTYQRDVRHDSRSYPIAGALAANIWPCAFWPNRPVEPPIQVTRQGPRNVLLINNLRDPATPFFGAVATRREFGARARLVGVDQGGHGVYLINPNRCANTTVTRYLVTGTMPPHDTICPARPGLCLDRQGQPGRRTRRRSESGSRLGCVSRSRDRKTVLEGRYAGSAEQRLGACEEFRLAVPVTAREGYHHARGAVLGAVGQLGADFLLTAGDKRLPDVFGGDAERAVYVG